MNSLITLTAAEVAENFSFVMTLVERGHTIKITSDETIALMTPIATKNTGSQLNIPDPEEFEPDPAGVAAYVSESLSEMTRDF